MLKALVLSLCASTALAHYTLDYPKSRGFEEEKEPEFCGGFPNAGERQSFPLKNGPIHLSSHHASATVWAFIATKPNPASLDDFNTTADGTSIPLLTDAFQIPQGESCWNVDFEKLNVGLKNGSEVTLQIKYDGGDSALYQCSDLTLLSDYTVPANETCTKDAALAGAGEASGSASAPSASGDAAGSASAPSGSASAPATSSPASAASPNAIALGAVGVATLVLAQAVLL